MRKVTLLIVAVAAVLATVGTAQDQDAKKAGRAKIAEALKKANFTLAEAVLRANRAFPGDVVGAQAVVVPEKEALKVSFDVYVLKDGDVHLLKVDSMTGAVAEQAMKDDDDDDDEKAEQKADKEEHVEKAKEGVKDQKRDAPAEKKEAGEEQSVSFGFEDQDAGQAPKGWTVAETNGAGSPGSWRVEESSTAPTGKKILRLATKNPDGVFNLLLTEASYAADLEVSVHIRSDSGAEDQGGGLVWRAKDANNYYVARWNPLEKNIRVYKVENGKRSMFKSAELDADTSKWHEIEATMSGAKGVVEFDGKKVLEFEDATFKDGGKVGLWTKSDASSSFDDFSIEWRKAK